ncbi:MAG: hypothetical protein ACLT0Y_03080 [Christensenellales bacterium]
MEIQMAVNIDVPDENIINRLSGRRVCKSCGATYHVDNHKDRPATAAAAN